MDKQTEKVFRHIIDAVDSLEGMVVNGDAALQIQHASALLDACTQPEQPQPAGKFPRVWVELLRSLSSGSVYPSNVFAADNGETTDEYVHISELEAANAKLARLREVALRVIERHDDESRSFGDEYEARREPLTEAISLLRGMVGD